MVVPTRLQEAAGRREFAQSTRTRELAIAKLLAAVVQADWRGMARLIGIEPSFSIKTQNCQ